MLLSVFGFQRLVELGKHLAEMGHEVAPALPVELDPLGGGAAEVRAVVAVGPTDHHLAVGVSGPLVMQAGELEHGVHRLRAGAPEEDPPVGVR